MESQTRARRKRTTRRDAKSWIVGEYTLSRILASFRVGRKLTISVSLSEKIVKILDEVHDLRQTIFPSDRQAYASVEIFRETYFMGDF